jgi:GT2 family glycosyltransferase
MEQTTYNTIGIGIVTYNSPTRLKKCLESIPEYLENIIIVNDGTPYEQDVYGNRYDVIQHAKNKGVAGAKNSALRYLIGKGCEHLFLIEDDIIIKDPNVFEKYIEASKKSGIKHFNYALQGYGNAKRYSNGTIEHPTPVYCVFYGETHICFYNWCSGPFMYIHKDCVNAIGYMDEDFYNIHEHVDFTARIIEAGLHPPFWYFADIANAHHYISDGPEFRNTTIEKDEYYDKRLTGADIYFNMKHGHKPLDMPRKSIEDLLLFLLNIKP